MQVQGWIPVSCLSVPLPPSLHQVHIFRHGEPCSFCMSCDNLLLRATTMTPFWITVITCRQGFAKLGALCGVRLWGSVPEGEREAGPGCLGLCGHRARHRNSKNTTRVPTAWNQSYLRPGWHQVLVKLRQKVASFLTTTFEALSVFAIWINSAGGNLLLNQYTILRRIFLHVKVRQTLSMFLNTAWKDDNNIQGWLTLSWGRKSGSGQSKQISHHTVIGLNSSLGIIPLALAFPSAMGCQKTVSR